MPYKIIFRAVVSGHVFVREIEMPFVPFPGLEVYLVVMEETYWFNVESVLWSEKDNHTGSKGGNCILVRLASFDGVGGRLLLPLIKKDRKWRTETFKRF